MDRRSTRRLKRCDDQWYISLCIEKFYFYCLTVYIKKIQVPHVAGYGCVLVESGFHPARGPTDLGFLSMLQVLGDQNVKFVRGEPVTFPVFIPQFLDACMDFMRGYTFVDGGSCRTPLTDMDDLSEFLALDCHHQQDRLLAKVKNGFSWQHILPDRSCVWREGTR
ncbi:hypothetical protein B9Z19DRAFT_1064426 [Tuber borchii]|uniref:Uncharacterized protein n=1 Tax=Tuber borchii TaxID=42251 RepID=A0A2T6ZUK4_TUBBO|nr:hypothetical protein B9Z19DRAFT_1064426 [Tuber borchii]